MVKVKVLPTQLCLTLPPMDCSLPGSSVLKIPQIRILEWVAIRFSRGLPHPGILHCKQILYRARWYYVAVGIWGTL